MSFDRIARHYRWIETVCAGQRLQRCRTAFLPEIDPPRRTLILGEGNGRFLAELLRQYPETKVTCVDASAAMLHLAKARLTAEGLDHGQIQFIHADITEWVPPQGEFDLIVTHFSLDCFSPEALPNVVGRLAAASTSEARWLVSDFREPESGLAKWRARFVIRSLYWFFRSVAGLSTVSLTPPDDLLASHGFRLKSRRTWEWGLLHSDLWITNDN